MRKGHQHVLLHTKPNQTQTSATSSLTSRLKHEKSSSPRATLYQTKPNQTRATSSLTSRLNMRKGHQHVLLLVLYTIPYQTKKNQPKPQTHATSSLTSRLNMREVTVMTYLKTKPSKPNQNPLNSWIAMRTCHPLHTLHSKQTKPNQTWLSKLVLRILAFFLNP
jgi:hypothetical protein